MYCVELLLFTFYFYCSRFYIFVIFPYKICYKTLQYFVEEYETIRALINMGQFNHRAKYLSLYKTIEDESGKLYLNTTSTIIYSNNKEGFVNVGELPVVLDENIKDDDKILSKNLKTNFLLIDILESIIGDFLYTLKNEPVLK